MNPVQFIILLYTHDFIVNDRHSLNTVRNEFVQSAVWVDYKTESVKIGHNVLY